ncbi:MAG: TetR/AcrR family transcriptional regulator [Clostridia bacterium]|nr:TetR/AcrR family transcriptional regulator [Clostridia bacterium]
MKKQPEITDATRDAFIDVFCGLALKKPIGSITIREITEAAGYNRTTFYRYFADVYTLLNYIEDSLIKDFSQSANVKGQFALNDNFFKSIMDFMQTNKDRMLVVFSESNRSSFIAKLQKYIMKNIGMENSAHNAMAMTIYFSGLTAALTAWLKEPDTIAEDDLTSMMSRLFSEWYLPEITKNKQ